MKKILPALINSPLPVPSQGSGDLRLELRKESGELICYWLLLSYGIALVDTIEVDGRKITVGVKGA